MSCEKEVTVSEMSGRGACVSTRKIALWTRGALIECLMTKHKPPGFLPFEREALV